MKGWVCMMTQMHPPQTMRRLLRQKLVAAYKGLENHTILAQEAATGLLRRQALAVDAR